MIKQKIHLICYSNGLFKKSQERLIMEAEKSGWFDTITGYDETKLSEEFKETFSEILCQKRGAGYWIWKFDIISKKMAEIQENDIVIYMDSGCSLNLSGEKRFNEYIEMVNNNDTGTISFQTSHAEKTYTIREIFDFFNITSDERITNSGQYMATIIVMRKCPASIEIIQNCINCLKINKLLITDYYNKNQEKYFKDARHDQSLLSVIRKMYDTVLLGDETYFIPFGNEESMLYPFWATRKK